MSSSVMRTSLAAAATAAFKGGFRTLTSSIKASPALLTRSGKFALLSQRGRALFKAARAKAPSALGSSPGKRVAAFGKMLMGVIVVESLADLVVDFFEGVDTDGGNDKLSDLRDSLIQETLDQLANTDPSEYSLLLSALNSAPNEDEKEEIFTEWLTSNGDMSDDMIWKAAQNLGIDKQLLFLVLDEADPAEVNALAQSLNVASDVIVEDATAVDENASDRASSDAALSRTIDLTNRDDLPIEYIADAASKEIEMRWGVDARRKLEEAGGVQRVVAIRDLVALSGRDFVRLVELAYGSDFARQVASES
jgi:hypothetical protein